MSHEQVPLSGCRTDSVIRGEIEARNRSPFTVVTTQGVYRRRRRRIRRKILKMSYGETNIF